MPKRTNFFQQLIRVIYENLPGDGIRVTESAEMYERSSGAMREIDILLEGETKGTAIRIAVECRDRSKRDDLQWIDGLIGKYVDLPVTKIIAVSRKGFSAPAVKKAAEHNIRAISLEKVKEIDWSNQFVKLGMMLVTGTTRRITVIFEIDPEFGQSLPKDAVVLASNGEEIGTLFEVFDRIYRDTVLNLVKLQLHERYFDLFKVVADLDKGIYMEIPINTRLAARVGEETYQIKKATFRTITTFVRDHRPVEHYTFENTLISFGKFDDKDFGHPFTVVQLPVPDTPNTVRLLTPPGAHFPARLDDTPQGQG